MQGFLIHFWLLGNVLLLFGFRNNDRLCYLNSVKLLLTLTISETSNFPGEHAPRTPLLVSRSTAYDWPPHFPNCISVLVW